jgi:lysophospholipase L1-like esterase
VPFINYLTNSQDVLYEEEIEDSESEDKGLIDRALAVWGTVRDTVSDVIGAGRTLLGLFSPELEAELDNGMQTFIEEFPKIITWIEINAPKATIIVNTIYNPIPDRILIIPIELSNKADELIKTMNNIIVDESKTRGYYVADIYSAFANKPDIMSVSQFNLNPFAGLMSVDIIHPNRAGNIIIADLVYEQYLIAREAK